MLCLAHFDPLLLCVLSSREMCSTVFPQLPMIRAECDSATDAESFNQDYCHHAYGCTRTRAPCSSSILRLALIAGSAYAARFTTCVVNTSPSRKCVRTRRTHPYQRRSKQSASAVGSASPNEQSAQEVGVSSSTDNLNFIGDDSQNELTVKRQDFDNHQQGSSKSNNSEEARKPTETTQTPLVPFTIVYEAKNAKSSKLKIEN